MSYGMSERDENRTLRWHHTGDSAPEEGVQIALEVIESVKMKHGVSGIHIMTLGWESIVQRIAAESGLCAAGSKI